MGAFTQSEHEYRHGVPDVQYSFDVANTQDTIKDPEEASETRVSPLAYYDAIVVRAILLHPKSRGAIYLNQTDPVWGNPLIYANYFSKSPDLEILVESMMKAMQLVYTKSFE